MKRLAGQAGVIVGTALHHLGLFILTCFLVLMLALGLLAFRLSLGPLQIPYLASVLANAVSGNSIVIHIGEADLGWAGYHKGGGVPLYLRLGHITASNKAGVPVAEVPEARLVFLPSALTGSGAPILVSSTDALFDGSAVPVSMQAAIRLRLGFSLARADLVFTLGAGRLGAGGDSVPITGGGFTLRLTPHTVLLQNGMLILLPAGHSTPHIAVSGSGALGRSWRGTLTVTADAVQATDLQNYWPPALSKQARRWVLQNIIGGTAANAKVVLGLDAPRGLDRVDVNSVNAVFDGDDVTMTWLPKAPPITGIFGQFTMTDPDTIVINATRGQLMGLAVHGAAMTITGVDHKDQLGKVTLTADGGIANVIGLLNAPPLYLLRQVPAALTKATGTVSATIAITLPLIDKLKLSEVDLRIDAATRDVRVPTPVDGLVFSDGVLNFHVTTQTLDATGTAKLAGEPASITTHAAFQSGEVLRFFELKTALGPQLLHRYGLDAETALSEAVGGAMPLDLRVQATAGGETAALTADLTPATLGLPPLGWSKKAGAPGTVQVAGTLADNGEVSVDRLYAKAPGLDVQTKIVDGRLDLRRLRIGRTEAAGEIDPPPTSDAPWRVELHGPMLDVRAILHKQSKQEAAAAQTPGRTPPPTPAPTSGRTPAGAAPSGPPWQVRLRFTQLALATAPAPHLANFDLTANGQGDGILNAEAHAVSQGGQPVDVLVKQAKAAPARPAFHIDAGDAGNLLQVLNAFGDLQNGALTIDGSYGAGAAMTGTLTLQKFRLLSAPAFGKVLQALTIYGVPEATSGPGLVFTKLVAPFSIARQQLTLAGARAFSASLGFTASGTVDLAQGNCDLITTIIPAYALNTLPSRIPIIGRLFSAEKGGGLFSVRVRISGNLANPKIAVNPFSALTPGAMRNLFGKPTAARK